MVEMYDSIEITFPLLVLSLDNDETIEQINDIANNDAPFDSSTSDKWYIRKYKGHTEGK